MIFFIITIINCRKNVITQMMFSAIYKNVRKTNAKANEKGERRNRRKFSHTYFQNSTCAYWINDVDNIGVWQAHSICNKKTLSLSISSSKRTQSTWDRQLTRSITFQRNVTAFHRNSIKQLSPVSENDINSQRQCTHTRQMETDVLAASSMAP